MNFKRYIEASDTWVDSHYIMGTDTDTITTLPADIYPNAATATVGLKGQTVQNGTPSPNAPIMPQGTGERTGNLFDKDATNVNNGYISYGYLKSDGSISTNIDYRASEYIRISQNQIYTLYYGSNLNNPSVCFYDSAKNYISGIAYAGRWHVPFTAPQNAEYLRLSFRTIDKSNLMLNLGSTPLPYEPFGIKIPISSANTTTLVYLGEVETTRQIAKYVFTGQETWVKSSQAFYTDVIDSLALSNYLPVCSHFISSFTGGICVTTGNKRLKLFESALPTGITTATEVQQYMLTQYTNGTPVTVWYVLATEETAVVNEPLMKIGEYADTVSNVSIPTIAGGDTLSVGTTVQPSEVTVNYKGWHPVSAVHERESGAWT